MQQQHRKINSGITHDDQHNSQDDQYEIIQLKNQFKKSSQTTNPKKIICLVILLLFVLTFLYNQITFLQSSEPQLQMKVTPPPILNQQKFFNATKQQKNKIVKNETNIDNEKHSIIKPLPKVQISVKKDIQTHTQRKNNNFNRYPQVFTKIGLSTIGSRNEANKKNYLTEQTILRFLKYRNLGLNSPQQSLIDEQKQYYQTMYKYSRYQQLPICIVVPSYNNIKNQRYKLNLNSLMRQQYNNFHIVYIDDASTDQTSQVVKNYIMPHKTFADKVKIIINKQNKGALYNLRMAAKQYCSPEDLFMVVDGDDGLVGTQVLKLYNFVFQKYNVWFVYSNYMSTAVMGYIGTSQPLTSKILEQQKYRDLTDPNKWATNHLPVYYTQLFNLIEDKDLQYSNGSFFKTDYDRAIIYPIVQFAGTHIQYLPEILYMYNSHTQLADNVINKEFQNSDLQIIRNYQKKQLIKCLKINDACIKELQNRWLLTPNYLQFCIISPTSYLNQPSNLNTLKSQSYRHWRAVYYYNGDNQQQFTKRQQCHNQNQVIMLRSLGNIGKNIYDGIINRCPRQDIIILLEQNESLNTNQVLQKLANQFKSKSIYAASVSYMVGLQTYNPSKEKYQYFNRSTFFTQHKSYSDLFQLTKSFRHLRVFRGQYYRRIPYIELMYENQTFFESWQAFLYPIVQYGKSKIINNQMAKKVAKETFNLPLQILVWDQILFKKQQEIIDINVQQLNFIGSKMTFPTIGQLVQWSLMNWGKQYLKLWQDKYDDNSLNVLLRNISSNQQKIPKIVHQIWIGKQLPSFKKSFMSRFKEVMPDYQYKLWGNQHITQENFPLTYAYIVSLKEIHERLPLNRMSMIADLMKFQIVYHYGGIYYDTNYQPFKPFSHLLHYPFIGITENPTYAGFQYIATSVFAAEPKSLYLEKLLSKKSLDSINLMQKQANIATGPAFLAKAFTPEDCYYKIKLLSSQNVYPFMQWYSNDIRWQKSKCIFNKNDNIPVIDGQVIETDKYKIINPCKAYPDAYGIDYWVLGGTWKTKRK